MSKYVVAAADEILPGERKLVNVRGRPILIFNLDGDYFGILDRCPHQGASLCKGKLVGLVEADRPGQYNFTRNNEIIRCAWHGWEFDIRTGKSRCEPEKIKATRYNIETKIGSDIIEGAYEAETFDVAVEDNYVVVNL
jgi:3-phenylpropionate/trans-cinnamate dioxygenase ferredoxin subunit